jgi:hypothetical protein
VRVGNTCSRHTFEIESSSLVLGYIPSHHPSLLPLCLQARTNTSPTSPDSDSSASGPRNSLSSGIHAKTPLPPSLSPSLLPFLVTSPLHPNIIMKGIKAQSPPPPHPPPPLSHHTATPPTSFRARHPVHHTDRPSSPARVLSPARLAARAPSGPVGQGCLG